MLSAIHGHDLSILFVLLAVIAFGGAVWCAFRGALPAAVACAFVGVLILVVT